MVLYALFGSSHFYEHVNVEYLLFLDLAVDSHRPGTSLEIFGDVGRSVFVGGEFIEIIVGRDILIGRLLFRRAEGAFLEAVNFGVGVCGERRSDEIAEGDTGDGGGADRERRTSRTFLARF